MIKEKDTSLDIDSDNRSYLGDKSNNKNLAKKSENKTFSVFSKDIHLTPYIKYNILSKFDDKSRKDNFRGKTTEYKYSQIKKERYSRYSTDTDSIKEI